MIDSPKSRTVREIVDSFYAKIQIAVIASACAALFGLWLSLWTGDWRWFSRSGSLIVVCGLALAKWDFESVIRNDNLDEFDAMIDKSTIELDSGHVTDQYRQEIKEDIRDSFVRVVRPRFSKAELYIVGVGTLVWGFGDIFNDCLNTSG